MGSIRNEVHVNRNHKDRLFCLRFGTEEYKEDALEVYNIMMNTNYHDPGEMAITTIGDVVYIKMKNDVSLLIDGNLALWEQQSSFNPNAPLRGLMYFGNLYSQYITRNKINIYSTALKKIPTPKYIIFYNGIDRNCDSVVKLRLSDAFIHEDTSGDFEWTATMYNLNPGKNEELLDKCKPLREYMTLINRIRANQENGMSIEDAVNRAVDSCIMDNVMKEFLLKHKAEVLNVCLTEFDEELYKEDIRKEGFEQGEKCGYEKARAEVQEEIARAQENEAQANAERDAANAEVERLKMIIKSLQGQENADHLL